MTSYPASGDDSKLAIGMTWLVSWEFELLERHRREMFASLNKIMDRADDVFREVVILHAHEPLWEGQHDPQEYDLRAEEYRVATESIPRIQWNSQFMAAFSVFEHLVCKLADHAQRRYNQKVSYLDFNGMGIQPAYDYLKKVAGLDKIFQSKEWQDVLVFKQLRNCLAHTRGEFVWSSTESKSLGQRMNRFSYWSVDTRIDGKQSEVSLTPEFVEMAIEIMKIASAQVCLAPFPAA